MSQDTEVFIGNRRQVLNPHTDQKVTGATRHSDGRWEVVRRDGKPSENHRKMVVSHGILWDIPSGNDQHSCGNHHVFNGQIHNFYGHVQLQC